MTPIQLLEVCCEARYSGYTSAGKRCSWGPGYDSEPSGKARKGFLLPFSRLSAVSCLGKWGLAAAFAEVQV